MPKFIKVEYGMSGSEKTAYINPQCITSIQINPDDGSDCDVNMMGSDTSKHCYRHVTVNDDLMKLMGI